MTVPSSSQTNAEPLITKLEQFGPLAPDDRAQLRRMCVEARHFGPGFDLIQQGDPSHGLLVVLDGFACRYKLRRQGVRQITAYLVPGDTGCPDEVLLGRADHAIGTLSRCMAVWISPEVVDELMQSPTLSRALRMNAAVGRATAWEWLVNVGRRSASERLAHLFCELLLRLQVVGRVSDRGYPLPITQHDLADTTGLTPVHINRTLGEFRRCGLISLRSRHLIIRDLPSLWALAEFDPAYLHLDERTAAWIVASRREACAYLLGQAQHIS